MKYIKPLSVSVYVLAVLLPIDCAQYDNCQMCKKMTKSFLKGMEATRGKHHDGGDVEWEKTRLPKYDISEIRFFDITDHVCKEDGDLIFDQSSQMQCRDYFDEYEEWVRKWFLKHRFEDESLTDWLCDADDKASACCPHGTFGSNCSSCPMHENKICNEHGFCNGIGTRFGTGKCDCYPGYTGDLCNSCASNYFATKEGDCERCNRACKDGCKGGSSAKHCSTGCVEGWNFVEGQGCQDIDECINQPCTDKNEQCVNTPGSYECKCKEGFELNDDGKCEIDVLARPLTDAFFGLSTGQLLRYSALFGLSVCFLVISTTRRTKLLWSLFFITLVLVCYVEFSSVADWVKNLTISDEDQAAFS